MTAQRNIKNCLQFALITIVAVGFAVVPFAAAFTSAASAATTSVDQESATLDKQNDTYSTSTDTSGLQYIEFSFDYDATEINKTDGDITLNYNAGSEDGSITITGQTGSSSSETGSVTLTGAPSQNNLNVSISINNTSDLSSANSDFIELTNITVSGDVVDQNESPTDYKDSEPSLCEDEDDHYDPESDLSGNLTLNGSAEVTNTSEKCNYEVGLAAYKKFNENIDDQELFDATTTVAAGSSTKLSVDVPECAYQIDLFYGDLLESLDGNRYDDRKLDYAHYPDQGEVGEGEFCSPDEEPDPEPYQCDAGPLHLNVDGDAPSELLKLNTGNGSVSELASFASDFSAGLAISFDGKIYTVSEDNHLKRLFTDGTIDDIGPLGIGGDVTAMDFGSDGNLYALTQDTDTLYEINTTTGIASEVYDYDQNELDVHGGDFVIDENNVLTYIRSDKGEVYYIQLNGDLSINDGDNPGNLEQSEDVGEVGHITSLTEVSDDSEFELIALDRNDTYYKFTIGGGVTTGTASYGYGDASRCAPEPEEDPAQLTLAKQVDNNENPEDGSATSSDFILEVRNASGTVVATSTGSTTGQAIHLPAGDYSITESTVGDIDSGDYTASFSDSCSQGSIYLEQGQDASCTVKNTEGEPLGEQCTPGKQWVDEVITSQQGTKENGEQITDQNHSDPQAMLDEANGNFWSIGKNGTTTLRFDEFIVDADGPDISIHEVTGTNPDNYPEETVTVEVSQDGDTWHEIGEASSRSSDDGQGVTLLDISSTELGYVQYVRLTDSTDYNREDDRVIDGFDIDAIDGVEGECDRPIPKIPQCETADQRWADNVVSYNPGDAYGGDTIANNRDNPSEATGPDGPSDDAIDFVSLGYGGELVLGFDEAIPNKSGDDLRIYETTYNNETYQSYPEEAKVYGSATGTSSGDWVELGTVTVDNGGPGSNATLDMNGKLSEVRFLRIVDTSTESDFNNKGGERDGFDVAGVEGLTCGDGEISQCQADILHMDTGLAGNADEGELFSVDSSTGSTTLELDYDTPFYAVLASENDDGDLFSIREDTDQLVTLENNEQMTNVGETMGLDKPVAMDFVAGTLYVLDQETDELHTIDPSDGSTSGGDQLHQGGNAVSLNVEGGDLTDPRDGSDTIIYVREDGEVFRIDPSDTSYEPLGPINSPEHITSAVKKGDTYYAMDREATNNDQDGTLYTFELDGDDIENVQTTSETGPYQYGDGTCGIAPENNDDGETGTISGVKYSDDNGDGDRDAGEAGIGGFRILAFENDPIADFEVEADDSDGVTPTTTFATSSTYIVEVSGTYEFGNTNGWEADAEYTSIDGFGTQAKTADPYFGTSTPDNRHDLITSQNNDPDWGQFRSNHTYRQITSGSNMPVNFRIADSNYSDNTGSLSVRIYEVTDMDVLTNPDGTYQFSNVPEGDYTVLEVNQPDEYEQTEPADGTCNVDVVAGETSECDFGNEPLNDDGDDNGGGNGGDDGDGGGSGGGGVLDPGGDDGSVLGDEDDADDGNDDDSTPTGERDLQEMLDEARKQAQDLLDTLENREQVAGVQSPGFPAGGDGSLAEARFAQADGATGAANNSQTATPTDEVAATGTDDVAAGTATTSEGDDTQDSATGTAADGDDGFSWGFWVALVGLLIVIALLIKDAGKTDSTTTGTDDPLNNDPSGADASSQQTQVDTRQDNTS